MVEWREDIARRVDGVVLCHAKEECVVDVVDGDEDEDEDAATASMACHHAVASCMDQDVSSSLCG